MAHPFGSVPTARPHDQGRRLFSVTRDHFAIALPLPATPPPPSSVPAPRGLAHQQVRRAAHLGLRLCLWSSSCRGARAGPRWCRSGTRQLAQTWDPSMAPLRYEGVLRKSCPCDAELDTIALFINELRATQTIGSIPFTRSMCWRSAGEMGR